MISSVGKYLMTSALKESTMPVLVGVSESDVNKDNHNRQ